MYIARAKFKKEKYMKKLLLGLGSIATIAAPIVAVVSCGDDNSNNHVDQTSKNLKKIDGINENSVDELKNAQNPHQKLAAIKNFLLRHKLWHLKRKLK